MQVPHISVKSVGKRVCPVRIIARPSRAVSPEVRSCPTCHLQPGQLDAEDKKQRRAPAPPCSDECGPGGGAA
eukprot:1500469-Pyramimonas_sp.AAC.1